MDNSAGSNLNAGSTTGAAVYTSTSGAFDGTSVYTPSDGQTTTSLVSVGDWCSIFPTANTTTPAVAQVTAVGAGVNGTITVSTTLKFGTLPGAVACKARTGGAWADLGMCASGVALNTGAVTQSTRINIKAGTYANTTTSRTLGITGTAAIPLHIRGYKATIGDQDTNANPVLGTDIPLITFTTQGYSSAVHQVYTAIAWLTTTGSLKAFTAANPTTLYSCFIENQQANVNANALGINTNVTLVGCQLKANALANVLTNSGSNIFSLVGCTIRGGLAGISMGAGSNLWVFDTVFDGQAGDAITFAGTSGLVLNGILVYGPGGNGITISGAITTQLIIANCHFENVNQASKAGINFTGTNPNWVRVISPSFYNCTANISGLGDFPTIFDNGTLGASGFTAPGSHDFSETTALKAIGFPGAFRGETYVGYRDNGAVQRQEPAGGGGTTVFSGEF